MNRRNMIIFVIFFLCATGILAIIGLIKEDKGQKLNTYLALGDSLALGVNSDGIIDQGYSGYTAEELISKGKIEEHYNQFARYNQKSSQLLKIVEQDAIGIINGQSLKISSLIKKSSLISVSIGLGDIISLFDYRASERSLYYDQNEILAALDIIQINLFEIIEEIKSVNEQAKIVLLGYYFCYPWIKEDQRAGAITLFNNINSIYQEVANDTAIQYVDISDIGDQLYLSNIHSPYPNADGYRKISKNILNYC